MHRPGRCVEVTGLRSARQCRLLRSHSEQAQQTRILRLQPLQLGSESRRLAAVYAADCLGHADQRMCAASQNLRTRGGLATRTSLSLIH